MPLALLWCVTTAAGQDWSAAQKDVWKTVEALWSAWQKEDIETVQSYIHPDYLSWNYREDVPSGFARSDGEAAFRARSTVSYSLTPLAIKVHDDFAIVHLRYSSVGRSKTDGKETKAEGRYTDVFIRQNGKWLYIGEHGGRMWPK